MDKIKAIIPGFLMCVLLSIIAIFLGDIFPSLGAAPIVIFFGIIAGNSFAKHRVFATGSKFSESNLLAYSIVLLGGTLSIETISHLGLNGVLFIIFQMFLTVAIAMFVGKKLGFSKRFSALMATGNGVCGSTAIGAASPVIKAEDTEKGITITIVNLTGIILMFLLVPIAKIAYGFETIKSSALVGGILQSVGQVIATGKMINPSVLEMAIIFKIVRIIFLVIVILWLSKEFKNKELESDAEFFLEKEDYARKKARVGIPWYIIGFFILCALFSLGVIPPTLSHIFKKISSKLELIAVAGIGMRVKLAELIAQGPKASLYGILVGTFQVIFALIFIKILL